MLYDPKWEKTETKADPFSLESLIAWLEKQPAGRSYSYTCNGHCLLAQYFTAAGFKNVTMWCRAFWHGDDRCPGNVGSEEAEKMGRATRFPPVFNAIAIGAWYACGKTKNNKLTFGAALERARAALAAV